MGFLVEINREDEIFLSNLATNPAAIFGKPYGGYILFLAGGAEKEILIWLSENLKTLDSLTGKHIAYALFVRRITVNYNMPPSEHIPVRISKLWQENTSRGVKEFSPENVKDPWSITRLFNRGLVMDGDTIAAITYAVDDIAEGLGILDELPCLVIFDAVPNSDFEILNFDAALTQSLITLLRQSVQDLISHPLYEQYMRKVQEIQEIDARLKKLQSTIDNKDGKIKSISSQELNKAATRWLSDCREALLSGKVRVFKSLTSPSLKSWWIQGLDDEQLHKMTLAHKNPLIEQGLVHSYRVTIDRLTYYGLEYQWPLKEPILSKYKTIYKKHLSSLVDGIPKEPKLDSPKECLTLRDQLEEEFENHVVELMSYLPSKYQLQTIARHVSNLRKHAIRQAIDKMREDQKPLEKRIIAIATEINGKEYPSFTEIFIKSATRKKLNTKRKQVQDGALTFAGSWLRPETLLKLWNVFAS